MKRNLMIAVGGDPVEVHEVGLARIDLQFIRRSLHQQIERANNILGGERFAVMPADAMRNVVYQIARNHLLGVHGSRVHICDVCYSRPCQIHGGHSLS